jgi:L-ascorbate metabolism protein UlaG (beta-lactamase superfamily)
MAIRFYQVFSLINPLLTLDSTKATLYYQETGDAAMKIKWYGHSAFQITTDSGTRIIIDPYESGAFGGSIAYGKIKDEADIVLTSHDHGDHNYIKDIKGKFIHIKEAGQYEEKGVKIKAIQTFHDKSKGRERGENLVFVVSAEDITITHLGDLGHILDSGTLQGIGKVDVLLLPVGGFFTIDAKEATKVMDDINPAITIAMHFKTESAGLPIEGLEGFIKDKQNAKEAHASEIVITSATLPKTNEIIIMRHAL